MDIRTTAPYLESCLSHLLAAGDLAYGLLTEATYSCGTASEFRRLRCREAPMTLSHFHPRLTRLIVAPSRLTHADGSEVIWRSVTAVASTSRRCRLHRLCTDESSRQRSRSQMVRTVESQSDSECVSFDGTVPTGRPMAMKRCRSDSDRRWRRRPTLPRCAVRTRSRSPFDSDDTSFFCT